MKRMEFVHINGEGDLVNRANGSLVSYHEAQAEIENARCSSEYWKAEHAAGNAEIARLNQRTQALIDQLSSRVNFVTPSVQIPRQSYEREIRIKCLEEAAVALDAFGKRLELDLDVANYLDCEAELRRLADELKR